MKNFIKRVFLLPVLFLLTACTASSLVTTTKSLPAVYEDLNDSYEKKRDIQISLFRLANFTDTPRAGMRAANIVEGLLRANEYKVVSHVREKLPSLQEAQKIAKRDKSKYFMYGGVSEWRYKTGIDGEPAVSIQLSLYKTKKAKLYWSATGSDSDWANASIGTTAQDLLQEMMFE